MSHPISFEQQRLDLWKQISAHCQSTEANTFYSLFFQLASIERFWTYPGAEVLARVYHYHQQQQTAKLQQLTTNVYNSLLTKSYREQAFIPFLSNLERLDRPKLGDSDHLPAFGKTKNYFEVLVIHPNVADYEMMYRMTLAGLRRQDDQFLYDLVFVSNITDAITAIITNPDIQACVHIWGLSPVINESPAHLPSIKPYLSLLESMDDVYIELKLKRLLHHIRPELDHYLLTELSLQETDAHIRSCFKRTLFYPTPLTDLHIALLDGIQERYDTPLFNGLKNYSQKQKGIFHALPIAQGMSVENSPWIKDMAQFYGANVFLAESSSTQGGLDSLLEPKGVISQAQHLSAKAYGAQHTFFVTGGTSAANKMVIQANLRPGDIVLVAADCHKSIPYAITLIGAYPIFLESYSMSGSEFQDTQATDLYGAVRLEQIKQILLDLKAKNLLDRVKQICLTNSTFDGVMYNVVLFMREILTIKPDMIFHWDEAWVAFTGFHPNYLGFTALSSVRGIVENFYDIDANHGDKTPVTLRVYVTQSTHKSTTAFRQASCIHVHDELFDIHSFMEAYRTHSTTSPNYQLLASMDVGRRQMSLEGYGLIQSAIELSNYLRDQINQSPRLNVFFKALTEHDLLPASARASQEKEFMLDPTRITLDVRRTGISGAKFRELLINKYDIQVNKTSNDTILLILNVGTRRETADYLLGALGDLADELSQKSAQLLNISTPQTVVHELVRTFHPAFCPFYPDTQQVADLRRAYFLGMDQAKIAYAPLSSETLARVEQGEVLVSAGFVTPYPPGFPVLMPGQLITSAILNFFSALSTREIHGFNPKQGFKVFRSEALLNLTK